MEGYVSAKAKAAHYVEETELKWARILTLKKDELNNTDIAWALDKNGKVIEIYNVELLSKKEYTSLDESNTRIINELKKACTNGEQN